jgi:hypothetical protein
VRDIKGALVEFIREMYVIQYSRYPNQKLVIKHCHEDLKYKELTIIPITVGKNIDVVFIWGKSKKVTSIDLYRKDFNDMPGNVMKLFRHKRSLDFYDFLIESDEPVSIPLNMIPEEFPLLFPVEEE